MANNLFSWLRPADVEPVVDWIKEKDPNLLRTKRQKSNLPEYNQTVRSSVKPDLMRQWLIDKPEAAYSSAISSLSSPMQNYFRPMFNTYYNRYLGELAQQEQPTGLEFVDWLGNIKLPAEFYQAGRRGRGGYTSNLAPRTRFLYY